jgi:hypothetical protein
MKKRFNEDTLDNLGSLETLALLIYNFSLSSDDYVKYIEKRLPSITDLEVTGYEIFEIANKDKTLRSSIRKYYHGVVSINVNGTPHSYGYNINENRVSFKVGDKSIRYYELYGDRDNEDEIVAEIIAIIKRVSKI